MGKLELINNLKLENVKLYLVDESYTDDEEVEIHFSIHKTNINYKIYLRRTNLGNWQVFGDSIYHNPYHFIGKDGVYCDYCKGKEHRCDYFSEYTALMLEKVKIHPSIRLKWLSLRYKGTRKIKSRKE